MRENSIPKLEKQPSLTSKNILAVLLFSAGPGASTLMRGFHSEDSIAILPKCLYYLILLVLSHIIYLRWIFNLENFKFQMPEIRSFHSALLAKLSHCPWAWSS